MTVPALPSIIVSGGQTGVDRAALDFALRHNIPCGGWCPAGRCAEDGPISTQYPLTETPTREYAERTEWNVRDSDGTLILTMGPPTSGTACTVEWAKQYARPCFVVDFSDPEDTVSSVHAWMNKYVIRKLNVAGPRESKTPGIYERALYYLESLFPKEQEGHTRSSVSIS